VYVPLNVVVSGGVPVGHGELGKLILRAGPGAQVEQQLTEFRRDMCEVGDLVAAAGGIDG
jgi:hypothetical protein